MASFLKRHQKNAGETANALAISSVSEKLSQLKLQQVDSLSPVAALTVSEVKT